MFCMKRRRCLTWRRVSVSCSYQRCVCVCVCTCAGALSFQSCVILCDLLVPLSMGFSRQILEWAKENREKQGRRVFQISCEFCLISQFACWIPMVCKGNVLVCIRFYIVASVLHTYGMCFICSCRRRIMVNTRRPWKTTGVRMCLPLR